MSAASTACAARARCWWTARRRGRAWCFAAQVDGAEVRTIESLAVNGRMNALQEAFWEKHGLQCGFCTPGMLMSATELLEKNPDPSIEEIREAVSSNLCRCTGYYNIVEAVQAAVAKMKEAQA